MSENQIIITQQDFYAWIIILLLFLIMSDVDAIKRKLNKVNQK